MEDYQREVVALIRQTGARLKILSDHRLVDLWREYSARQYRGGWIKGDRQEAFRFITWSNHQLHLPGEILVAMREKATGRVQIRKRTHTVRAWGGKVISEHRLKS